MLQSAISKETITRGLKYSLATGNWGLQGTAGLRAGVSQVGGMLASQALMPSGQVAAVT